MTEEEDLEKFKIDLAKFSGNYREFVVIVKTPENRLLWRATDVTWGVGACARYLNCQGQQDRIEEDRGTVG